MEEHRKPMAKSKVARKAGHSRAAEPPALPAGAGSALDEFLFHIGLVRGVSPRTVAAYRSDLTAMHLALAKRGIEGPAGIAAPDLRRYLIELHESGRRPASVARVRSALRSYFAFLIDEGILLDDPSADLPAPAGWRRVPRALTEAQVTCLLESVSTASPLGARDRALLEVAYGTGARASELLGLRLGDCRWDERLLRFVGKGQRVRLVPLGAPALDALITYTETSRPVLLRRGGGVAEEEGIVFLNARGGALGRMGFWKILRQRATAAGLPEGIHPHLLRHTYATHLLHRGASLRVVQELLGHSRLATTQIYTSVDAAYLQSMHGEFHPRG
jgi:integrase/recombinase XerD